jgi:hypothetical protein
LFTERFDDVPGTKGFFSRLLKIKLNVADAHNARGNALKQLKRFDEALARRL